MVQFDQVSSTAEFIYAKAEGSMQFRNLKFEAGVTRA